MRSSTSESEKISRCARSAHSINKNTIKFSSFLFDFRPNGEKKFLGYFRPEGENFSVPSAKTKKNTASCHPPFCHRDSISPFVLALASLASRSALPPFVLALNLASRASRGALPPFVLALYSFPRFARCPLALCVSSNRQVRARATNELR